MFSYYVLVEIPLEAVRDSWQSEWGPLHKRALAEHHGIYRDLFNDAYFIPVVDMKVLYDYDDEFVTPIHLGNSILPSEVGTRKTSCNWCDRLIDLKRFNDRIKAAA